jgi:hypothetical protein
VSSCPSIFTSDIKYFLRRNNLLVCDAAWQQLKCSESDAKIKQQIFAWGKKAPNE